MKNARAHQGKFAMRNLFKSARWSSTKSAAQMKAKNATMCPASNVQWSTLNNAAMWSAKFAMTR